MLKSREESYYSPEAALERMRLKYNIDPNRRGRRNTKSRRTQGPVSDQVFAELKAEKWSQGYNPY